MKRVLFVLVAGALTFGTIYGFAASLNLNTDKSGCRLTLVADECGNSAGKNRRDGDGTIPALDLPRRPVHRESKKPAHCLDPTYQSRSDDGRATVVMDDEVVLSCN